MTTPQPEGKLQPAELEIGNIVRIGRKTSRDYAVIIEKEESRVYMTPIYGWDQSAAGKKFRISGEAWGWSGEKITKAQMLKEVGKNRETDIRKFWELVQEGYPIESWENA